MAKNSLFAILLRSPWWISAVIALAVVAAGIALLPVQFRVIGVLSALPFVVIAVIAAKRQWHVPSATRVAAVQQALAAMPWPAFAALLQQAFERDGYAVQRHKTGAIDFELERRGRRTLVSAKRWKSARTGLEPLRTLQAACSGDDAPDALYIGLGPVSDNALPFAAEHRIAIWQATELTRALRGLPLPTT